jgi:hypothetical protein
MAEQVRPEFRSDIILEPSNEYGWGRLLLLALGHNVTWAGLAWFIVSLIPGW